MHGVFLVSDEKSVMLFSECILLGIDVQGLHLFETVLLLLTNEMLVSAGLSPEHSFTWTVSDNKNKLRRLQVPLNSFWRE